MAIPIKDLEIGSVVRLVSGSPKFAVERIQATNRVELVGWGDRVGFVTRVVHPDLLCWPRPSERADDAPAATTPEDEVSA